MRDGIRHGEIARPSVRLTVSPSHRFSSLALSHTPGEWPFG